MKKSLFLIPMVAIGLFSCSEKDIPNSPEQGEGKSNAGYLTVNIISGGSTLSTRSDDFQGGTDLENQVKSIRFYFFDDSGNGVNVNESNCYLDWNINDKGENTTSSNNSPERILQAHLILQVKVGSPLPSYVVAVANPTDGLLKDQTITTSAALKSATVRTTDFSSENGFLMSNTIYLGNATNHGTSAVGYISTNQSEAQKKPLNINIERMLAKVEVNVDDKLASTTIGTDTYKFKLEDQYFGDDYANQATDEKAIYVHILGWNVTSTSNKSYVIKNLHNSWEEGNLWPSSVGTAWNDSSNERSYWALNPADVTYNYLPYSAMDNIELGGATYAPENAAKASATKAAQYGAESSDDAEHTKVVIAAVLEDKEGNPLDLAQWSIYRDNKEKIIGAMLNQADLYVAGTNTKISSTHASKFELVSAYEADKTQTTGLWKAYLRVKPDNFSGYSTTENGGAASSAKEINDVLEKLGTVRLWNQGKTYFYVNIKHLNPNGADNDGLIAGQYGVVRNHYYKVSITSIAGLGTPVPDDSDPEGPEPDDPPIIPEQPDTQEAYMYAQIQILPWKVVEQNAELTW